MNFPEMLLGVLLGCKHRVFFDQGRVLLANAAAKCQI